MPHVMDTGMRLARPLVEFRSEFHKLTEPPCGVRLHHALRDKTPVPWWQMNAACHGYGDAVGPAACGIQIGIPQVDRATMWRAIASRPSGQDSSALVANECRMSWIRGCGWPGRLWNSDRNSTS